MKSVVLASVILSLPLVVYSPEADAINIPSNVSNAVTKQNIILIEDDNQSLKSSALRHTSISSRCSNDINNHFNYQLTFGHFVVYFLFSLICLILLFELWLDYNLSRTKNTISSIEPFV